MRKILCYTKLVIVLVAIITCQGCGGGAKPDANAPAADAAGAPGGQMPSSYDPTTSQAGGPGAADAGPGMLAGGAEGDGYRADDGTGPMPGDDAVGLPGDVAGAPGYGADYAAGMQNAGAEGGAMPGYPGDGGFGMGQMAIKDPAPPEDADYMTKAKYAFAIGKEAAAHQYLYAHILSNDAEADSLLKQMRWLPAGLKPAATTRFAAAVVLDAPTNLADLKPIGSQQLSGAGGGGGGVDMGMGGGPQGAAKANARAFQDMTGEFGDAIVAAFETRWSAGDFGSIFNQVTAITPMNRGPGGMAGMAGGMPGMDGAMGMMSPGAEGGGAYGAGDGTTAARTKTMAGKSIIPGLLFLGTGNESDLMLKAEKEGIDALFLFEVKVEVIRMTGIVQNDTRVRLVLASGKSLGATQKLNNVKIENAQMRGGNNDVERAVAIIFKKLDTPEPAALGLKLVNLPAIKPEHAKARIGKVIASKPKDILRALTEFRLYHSLGLITDAEKSQAFQLALDGSDGEILAASAEEDRKAILDPKLPAYK